MMNIQLDMKAAERRAPLIEKLHAIQEEEGYLPAERIAEVAAETGLSPAQVMGVATFYNHFHLRPPGKHTIKVCDGTACHVKGAGNLLERIQTELNIKPGESTEDGLFSLEVVACLGACSMAPAIVIDDTVHGRVTPKELRRILNSYRRRR
ncbi:MAG: NADH-quinone oxidoreductase subunit NuoE [Firmicutes bacterium]|jgi:NADH-quinone oxidoreductase subunit E/NADP-reducing hydrogenase subunit HndA|nr:NADH-quinone oxidoreductase subunit NuoE [Bacillota bacterium]